MIQFESVTFKHSKAKEFLFENYSLNLDHKGGVYGLFGKNGVGKSTFLYLIAGLLKPHNGSVKWNGKDVKGREVSFLSDVYLVPEVISVPKMSLKQFLSLNAPFYPKFSYDDMKKYLNIFEMDEDVNLGRLSMGETKKIIISFAWATNCSLILMDEPTNGLDIPSKSFFRQAMSSMMVEDKMVVISTHQVRDLEQIIDNVIIIKENELVMNSSVADIENALYFDEYPTSDKSALWECSTVKGYKGLFINDNNSGSPIDIETLFNASMAKGDIIANLFKNLNK